MVALLNAQYDDVLVCGVKEGCVIVTFMIRNCLLPSLKAFYESEKRNTTCQWELKFKIMKVMIEDRVVYMSGTILSKRNDQCIIFLESRKEIIEQIYDTPK